LTHAGKILRDHIQLFINSPGGVITAGLAIYDTMQFIRAELSTICIGQASSMAATLLAAYQAACYVILRYLTFSMPGGPKEFGLYYVTILLAVAMALVQKDYKRLLSYHAISQVGYMILGLGTAVPAGIVGGLFHMINNALYKNALFLTGGAVEKQAGGLPVELIITHGHADHAFSAGQFKTVYLNRKENGILPKNVDPSSFKDIRPGDLFDLGGTTLRAYDLPGHTPGSMVLSALRGGSFSAEMRWVEEIIDPRDTRPLLIEALEIFQ
jgi:hypothetical protein